MLCAPVKACRAGVGDGSRESINLTVYPNFTCKLYSLLLFAAGPVNILAGCIWHGSIVIMDVYCAAP